MKTTLSVIKADVGSIGGHLTPSRRLLESVAAVVQSQGKSLIMDHYIGYTGDDIAILTTHTRGTGNQEVHKLAGMHLFLVQLPRKTRACTAPDRIC